MKYCPECGSKVIAGAKFCPECGYKILAQNEKATFPGGAVTKVSSDVYIKRTLAKSGIEDTSVIPNIAEKTLLTASKTIARDTNPALILGIMNTALFKKGKTGAVFTGTEVFVRGMLENSVKIPYEGIVDVAYNVERKGNSKRKITEVAILTVDYQDGNSIRVDSEQLDSDFPLEFLAQLLQNFNLNVDQIETNIEII